MFKKDGNLDGMWYGNIEVTKVRWPYLGCHIIRNLRINGSKYAMVAQEGLILPIVFPTIFYIMVISLRLLKQGFQNICLYVVQERHAR